VGVPHGANKLIGLATPSAWSFDAMKRFSTLDTLEREGSDPSGKTRGLGLYKSIETENAKAVTDARRDLEELKKRAAAGFDAGEVSTTVLPQIADAATLPDDLSGYVTFLHPWMNEVLNQIILVLMFGILMVLSLVVLRLKDLF